MPNTDSPCIGICSTTYGDQVCRGCKRHYDEVISWNAYQDHEKLHILDRINESTAEIVEQFLQVFASERLEKALRQSGVRYRQDDHPLTWALQLLKFADNRITCMHSLGIKVAPDYEILTTSELCSTIDKALYVYACELQEKTD